VAEAQIPDWAIAVMAFFLAVVVQNAGPFVSRLLVQQSGNTSALASLLARVETMEEKQAAHEGIKEMVTRLDEQLIAMRQQISNQGPVIAQVVAVAIRETFGALGIDRRGVARA